MLDDILFKAVGKIASTVIRKIIPEKAADQIESAVSDVITSDAEVQQALQQQRDFILKYEGEAKEMPKTVQVVRAMIRPALTALFGLAYFILTLYGGISGRIEFKDLFMIFGAQFATVMAWWFGERSALKTPSIKTPEEK